MKIALVSIGTRGDVQPFCALALALQPRGFDPLIVTNANHAAFVARFGLRFQPIDCDTAELYASQEGRDMLRAGKVTKLVEKGAAWIEKVRPALESGIAAGVTASDAVLSGFLVDDIASSLAEAQGKPFLLSGFAPYIRTPGIPNLLIAQKPLPFEALNILTHQLADRLAWRPKARAEADLRRRLGLPPVNRSRLWRTWAEGGPYLGAWSPALFPAPQGWGARMTVTGPWRPTTEMRASMGESEPPAALTDWLGAGQPPVFVSFGSMPMLDPERLLDWLTRIHRATGQRFLIGAGWSDLAPGQPAPGLRVERAAIDHDWLFPRCAMVVHHGGAGTTDTTLRARRPGLAVSLFADGPFWGHRLRTLGVGDHIAFSRLDEAGLASAVARLVTPEPRARAEALARQMQGEDGAELAARQIEGWLWP
jgi:sterol 3beta-glucosyltransferase